MLDKYLIREFNDQVELLQENAIKVKDDYVYKNVLLQVADKVNANNRIYPFKVLKEQVEQYQTKIKNKQAVGELGHPERAEIDPKLISHHIDSIWMTNNEVRGDVRILSKTREGAETVSLIESDIKLGLSSRGLGSIVNKGNHIEVQNDFSFVCWDIVIDPSTAKAFLNESRSLIPYNQSVLQEANYKNINQLAELIANKYRRQ